MGNDLYKVNESLKEQIAELNNQLQIRDQREEAAQKELLKYSFMSQNKELVEKYVAENKQLKESLQKIQMKLNAFEKRDVQEKLQKQTQVLISMMSPERQRALRPLTARK